MTIVIYHGLEYEDNPQDLLMNESMGGVDTTLDIGACLPLAASGMTCRAILTKGELNLRLSLMLKTRRLGQGELSVAIVDLRDIRVPRLCLS